MSKKLSNDVEKMLAAINVAEQTQHAYRRTVRHFSEFVGKPAKRKHLTEEIVNKWLIQSPSSNKAAMESPCRVKRGRTLPDAIEQPELVNEITLAITAA